VTVIDPQTRTNGSLVSSAGLSPTGSCVRDPLCRILRDPYVAACAAVIVAWTGIWLAAFPNLYGWLTDDAMTFARIRLYEQGGIHLLDIPWFHAYMWILMTPPLLFHWAVPSHEIPRAWQYTPQFRALILYTILLHSILLCIVAYFLTKLSSNRWVCFGAFLLWVTSPTLIYFADLLDSRYLGFLFGIPAMIMLLNAAERMNRPATWKRRVTDSALPGFLMAVGQAVHYNCVYLCGTFALAYWGILLFRSRWNRTCVHNFWLFVLGGMAWIIPVELLSLAFHPFPESMLGLLIMQVQNNVVWPHQPSNLSQWTYEFYHEMGAPLMLATFAGGLMFAWKPLRPTYAASLPSLVMVWSCAIMTAYIVFGHTYPLYRDVSGFQIFYMLFAMVAFERLLHGLRGLDKMLKILVAVGAIVLMAYVPTFLRSPEVFVAQQGLGRAVNYAYSKTNARHVFFMATYDWDPNPHAIITRAQFDALRPSDYLITDYPIFNHIKYPDLFALLHDVKPVASFPTLWCTQENWVEVGPYFDYRPWQDEPMNCEAQVYKVADIWAAEKGPILKIAKVTADSTASAYQSPSRVFAVRNPTYPVNDDYLTGLHDLFEDLWKSEPTPFPHWLQVRFVHLVTIGAVTIVPPDWEYVGRIREMEIWGSSGPLNQWHLLWSRKDLLDKSIFTARFRPTRVDYLRFVIERQGRHQDNSAAAIVYMTFPGYRVDASAVLRDGAFMPYMDTSQVASGLAIGPNGCLWLLGQQLWPGGHAVYVMDKHGALSLVPGAQVISVAPFGVGEAHAVNSPGELYRFDAGLGRFLMVPGQRGRLIEVARGAGQSAWVLDGDHRVFFIERGRSREVCSKGCAASLTSDLAGSPWIITSSGAIAAYDPKRNTFREIPHSPRVRALAVGGSDDIWYLDGSSDSEGARRIYRYDLSQGRSEEVPGLARAISVAPDGRPWILGPDGRVYRFVGRFEP